MYVCMYKVYIYVCMYGWMDGKEEKAHSFRSLGYTLLSVPYSTMTTEENGDHNEYVGLFLLS